MNLYKRMEWQSLKKIERAQLLLVIEGLKRGAIIEGNWTYFMDILAQTGLSYVLDTSEYSLYPVVKVTQPETLEEFNRGCLTLSAKTTVAEYNRILGWLLNYPECCTQEFVKEKTHEQKEAKRKGQCHLSYKFGQELDAKIKAEGNYPDIFDYRPATFTPCGIECPEATKVLTSWKEAIDALDPEAGRELVYYNRLSLPQRLAHKEYLHQERQRRGLECRLQLLRESVL
ncbi:DUF483 domain-containing protein [Candidatus Woesearchaeota archaeon]|nr:DUF483 domain-containing protein [Candidatus Woesearchaeota archaeon]